MHFGGPQLVSRSADRDGQKHVAIVLCDPTASVPVIVHPVQIEGRSSTFDIGDTLVIKNVHSKIAPDDFKAYSRQVCDIATPGQPRYYEVGTYYVVTQREREDETDASKKLRMAIAHRWQKHHGVPDFITPVPTLPLVAACQVRSDAARELYCAGSFTMVGTVAVMGEPKTSKDGVPYQCITIGSESGDPAMFTVWHEHEWPSTAGRGTLIAVTHMSLRTDRTKRTFCNLTAFSRVIVGRAAIDAYAATVASPQTVGNVLALEAADRGLRKPSEPPIDLSEKTNLDTAAIALFATNGVASVETVVATVLEVSNARAIIAFRCKCQVDFVVKDAAYSLAAKDVRRLHEVQCKCGSPATLSANVTLTLWDGGNEMQARMWIDAINHTFETATVQGNVFPIALDTLCVTLALRTMDEVATELATIVQAHITRRPIAFRLTIDRWGQRTALVKRADLLSIADVQAKAYELLHLFAPQREAIDENESDGASIIFEDDEDAISPRSHVVSDTELTSQHAIANCLEDARSATGAETVKTSARLADKKQRAADEQEQQNVQLEAEVAAFAAAQADVGGLASAIAAPGGADADADALPRVTRRVRHLRLVESDEDADPADAPAAQGVKRKMALTPPSPSNGKRRRAATKVDPLNEAATISRVTRRRSHR